MSRPVSSTSAGRRSSKFSCGRHSINTTWLKRPEKINPQLSGLIEIGSLSVRYVHSLNAPAFFENNDLDASFPTVPVERVTAIDAVGLPVTFKNKNGQVGMIWHFGGRTIRVLSASALRTMFFENRQPSNCAT